MCICYRKATKEVNQKCNHCETKSKVSIIMEKTHDEIWDAIIAEIRFQIARDENQSSIAKKLGVSRVAVHRWLKGDRGSARKTIDDLKAYMNALGMNTSEFFGEVGLPSKPIPLIGLVPCGYDYWLKEVKLPITEVPAPPGETRPNMFAVIASGDSLVPVGIEEGFVVFCDPDAPVNEKDIVYVERDNGTTTLKIYGHQDEIWTYLHGWSPFDSSGTLAVWLQLFGLSAKPS